MPERPVVPSAPGRGGGTPHARRGGSTILRVVGGAGKNFPPVTGPADPARLAAMVPHLPARRPRGPRQALLPVLAIAAATLWHCGGDTLIRCPAGSQFTNGICCPPGHVGQGNQCVLGTAGGSPSDAPDAPGPNGDAAASDTAAPPWLQDATAHDGPAAGGDRGQGGDRGPFQSSGAVGAPCRSDADCGDEGAVCLSWGGGACAVLGCVRDDDCPDGSACAPTGGGGVCLQRCAADDDCRTDDGIFCKGLVFEETDLVSVCHGTDPDATEAGGPCTAHEGCLGAAACRSSLPGGLCAELGCSPTSCPAGTACVLVDGLGSCLRTCVEDADCAIGGATGRSCEALDDLRGQPVQACFVPRGSEPIGAACTSGHVCASGLCRLGALGVCAVDAERPCRSAADCPSGQACRMSPDLQRGACSARCSLADPSACQQGGALCTAAGGDGGFCSPTCAGPDDASCRGRDGLVCAFGAPVGAAEGRYACVVPSHPSPLTACTDDAPCGAGGRCLLPAEGAGYCSTACAADGGCPFPGRCVQGEGGLDNRCYRACNSVQDCPAGLRCAFPDGAAFRACTP